MHIFLDFNDVLRLDPENKQALAELKLMEKVCRMLLIVLRLLGWDLCG